MVQKQSMISNTNSVKPGVRASKACKHCSQRKVKCDAIKNGLPCSRCRMDKHDDCALIPSRRGTYDRKCPSRRTRFRRVPASFATQSRPALPPCRSNRSDNESIGEQEQITIQGSISDTKSPQSTASQHAPTEPTVTSTTVSGLDTINTPTNHTPTNWSLNAKFEDYLTRRSARKQAQHGLTLLGELSPLTFALEELPQKLSLQFHNASDHIRDSANLPVIQQDIHPSHLDAADVAYLKAKGCFSLPSEPMLSELVEAYLTRFHPHYSIMNKQEVENCHREKRLPWILLHAISFIGATFCDTAVIHRSEFPSRLDARRSFYQKATALFQVGYDRDKFILLQTAIILSFWGPQMQSHWNPCSWVGFGVTFAVSLGIHRSAASSHASRADKGLLRKIWWALVVRDTFSSVLLGQPFQIDLTQSDTGMLVADDFTHESHEDAFYQTQITKLSKILRDIMHCRLGPASPDVTRETIHTQLDEWHLDLRLSLEQWTSSESPPFTCSTALELLYDYSIICLYIDNPSLSRQETSPRPMSQEPVQQDIVQFAAKSIASNAITLLTKATVSALPHELFLGFFVAGVVLYRLTQHKDDSVAQMAQASLDNCRIVLNEIQEAWGPGHWAMQMFDFLCADHNDSPRSPAADGNMQPDRSSLGNPLSLRASGDRSAFVSDSQKQNLAHLDDDILLGLNWEPMMCEELTGCMENHLLMPNFAPSDMDRWSFFQPCMY